MKFYIKEIAAEDTLDLRQLTLRPHQKSDQLIYPGDYDHETIHFGLFCNDKLSGIASVYNEPLKGVEMENSWRLRGMAVTENIRGKGFGNELMKNCIGHIRSKNAQLLWCNARLTAEGFYEKFGMKRKGEVFTPEDLGEHIVMVVKF